MLLLNDLDDAAMRFLIGLFVFALVSPPASAEERYSAWPGAEVWPKGLQKIAQDTLAIRRNAEKGCKDVPPWMFLNKAFKGGLQPWRASR